MAAGDITSALLTELGLKLEDETPNKFSNNLRYEALNDAQIRIATLLHSSYLSEFQNIDEDADISSGSIAFSAIDSGGIIGGAAGIVACKVKPGGTGSGLWAHPYDVGNLRIPQESYLHEESDTNILYYVWASTVNFMLDTLTSSTADIYYLDYPAAIASGVDPVLNVGLHHILTDFAAAYCLKTDEDLIGKSKDAEDRGILQIKILNDKILTPST